MRLSGSGWHEMTREFIITTVYDRLWEKLNLTDEDLRELQILLMKYPSAGSVIQGTGGARKIRFALLNTGKSSGIRVIYVDIAHLQKIYLLLCYQKNQQDDLTQAQKKQVKALIESLRG